MSISNAKDGKPTFRGLVFYGFLLCLLQVSFTWIFAPKEILPAHQFMRVVILKEWDTSPGNSILTRGLLRFNNWDSLRFFEIARNGYHLPDRPLVLEDIHSYRTNVTTPPAYPFAVRLIQNIFKIPGEVALLVTAQLACWLFWIYFLMILVESGLSMKELLASALTVAAHPAAFYLVVGYTESLFMASFLGLIYWTDRWMKKPTLMSWIIAACHGFIGTATRIAGFPIAIYPIFKNWGDAANWTTFRRRLFSTGLLSIFASLGLISFFLFCYLEFGHWNLYFSISKMVAQEANYFAIFDPRSYIPRYFFEDTMLSINRTAVPWTLGLMVVNWRLDLNWRKRWGLYGTAFALFFMTMAGKANSGMDGMIRYTLPIFVVEILNLAQVLHERSKLGVSQKKSFKFQVFLGAAYLLSVAVQGWIAWRFLHGRWVS